MNVVAFAAAVGMYTAKVLLMVVAAALAMTTQQTRPPNHLRQAAQQYRHHQTRSQRPDQNRSYFEMTLQT
jgi:hypothetical protein